MFQVGYKITQYSLDLESKVLMKTLEEAGRPSVLSPWAAIQKSPHVLPDIAVL